MKMKFHGRGTTRLCFLMKALLVDKLGPIGSQLLFASALLLSCFAPPVCAQEQVLRYYGYYNGQWLKDTYTAKVSFDLTEGSDRHDGVYTAYRHMRYRDGRTTPVAMTVTVSHGRVVQHYDLPLGPTSGETDGLLYDVSFAGPVIESTTGALVGNIVSAPHITTMRTTVPSPFTSVDYVVPVVVTLALEDTCHIRVRPGTVTNAVSSVDVGFALGRAGFGEVEGSLRLQAATPTPSLASPVSLTVVTPVNAFTNRISSSNTIRQVLTPLSLVHITSDSEDGNANGYSINFFPVPVPLVESNGLFVISATTNAYKRITVANADAGVTNVNKLWVTELSDSSTNRTVYSFNTNPVPDLGWTVEFPSGLGQESLLTGSSNSQATIETRKTLSASGTTVAQVQSTYTNYADGLQHWLIESKADPNGSSPATSSYSYFVDPTNEDQFGRVKEQVNPNGAWARHDYGTNAGTPFESVVSAFLDATNGCATNVCRAVVTTYGTANPVITTREWLLGQWVSTRYCANSAWTNYEIQAWTPNAAWDDTNNLVTTRVTDSGSRLPRSIRYPDGTMEFYAYSTNTAKTERTATVSSGQPKSDNSGIQEGTQAVTVVGLTGEILSRTVQPITNGVAATNLLARETNSYAADDFYREAPTIQYLDGTTTTNVAACCGGSGPESLTDKAGTTTLFTYDALDRETSRQTAGITLTNILDAAGRVLETRRLGTDQSTKMLRQTAYDLAGRPTADTNALTGRTGYSYSYDGSGHYVRTTTYPDSGTRIETFFKDGQLKEVSGTAVRPVRYDYGVETNGTTTNLFKLEVRLDASGSTNANEWTKTYFDALKRPYKVVYAAAPGETNGTNLFFYNWKGQLWKQVDPDGVTTLLAYNGKGELEYRITALSATAKGLTNYATLLTQLPNLKTNTDRIAWTTNDFLTNYGTTVRRSRTYTWATNGVDSATLLSTVEISADGLRTWQTTWNGSTGITNQTQVFYAGGGSRVVTNIAADGSLAISAYQDGRLASVTRQLPGGAQLGQTTYGYDAHGRPYLASDARNGTTVLGFNNADMVTTVTTPVPDAYHASQTTQTLYDKLGRATNVVYADSTAVTNEFWPTGLLKRSYGSRTYPAGYGYDAQGRMTSMTNWTAFVPGGTSTGARVTTWKYDAYRGFMTNKVYDGATPGPSYTYKPSGRLLTRSWARGIQTTYGYNDAGDLQSVAYANDPAGTPNLTYDYDRRGRQRTITPATGTTLSFSFNDASELTGESYSGGVLAGLSITNTFDAYLRRYQNQAANGGTILASATFGYDAASRLTNVTDGTYSAGYTYVANSPLVDQITFQQSGTTKMISARYHDALNRLVSVVSAPVPGSPSALPVSFTYDYNDANQRTERVDTDGSFWQFGYDALGQVTSGRRFWGDNSPVAGQLFGYTFDQIGNRTASWVGGDANGNGLRSAGYSANSLNQYTSRGVSGGIDVVGEAHVAANVTVNGAAPTSRHGTYFQSLLTVGNSSNAVWQPVTDIASLGSTSATNSGYVFVPKASESFGYDADGNLTNDGRWNLTWDAENRLKQIESQTSAPSGSKRRVAWDFDALGRRVRQTTWDGSSGTYVVTNDLKFLSDGWRCVAELNATNNSLVRSYLWGLDLSGSEQGAGGVGGLLAVKSAANGGHFCGYDGNGNVAGLYSPSTATWSARYEYGPFGEPIRASGPMAFENPFRFSTKRTDNLSQFVLYEYRAYSPGLGRWLSRDPIAEAGGVNLYGFLGNSPVARMDVLGLFWPFDINQEYWDRQSAIIEANQRTADPDYLDRVVEDVGGGARSGGLFQPGQFFQASDLTAQVGRTVPESAIQTAPMLLGAGEVEGAFAAADAALQAARTKKILDWLKFWRWKKCPTKASGVDSASTVAKSRVWSMGPGPRGLAIESQLGGNLPAGFRVIDRFEDGVATSIKSIDLNATTYQNAQALGSRLNDYIDKLAGWTGQTTPYAGVTIQPGQVTAKTLQIAVPPGSMSAAQQAVIDAATQRAQGLGLNFVITPVP
jgi:RHS repeat-associated protein